MSDQPQTAESAPAAEATPEERLASFFGAKPKVQATQPDQPQENEPEVEGQAEQDAAPEPLDEEGDEPEQEAEAVEEIDWNGKKLKIPAELKPALMMQSDYTRKTMELAEIRKGLEAERFTQQMNQTFIQQVQPLMQKQNELLALKEQAKKIDWTSLTTDQKIDLDRELRKVDNDLAEINSVIGNQYQQHNQQFGSAVLQAVGATEAYMARKVPGWDREAGTELHNYGLWLGIPKAKLTTGYFADPQATEVMWKAMQYDKLQLGKPAVQNKASNAPPVVKPGSNAAQGSVRNSNLQKARSNLRKTGSLEDAAAVFLRMK